MKNKIAQLSTLKKLLLLAAVVGVVLSLLALIGLIWNQPGWVIGIAAGTIVEMINIALLFKGSSLALKETKASLFLLCYFTRIVLFIGVCVLLVASQFAWKVPAFTNSVFGLLIGITPLTIVVCVVMVKSDKNAMNIGELK